MHVLVIPSWYTSPQQPWSGIFFADHAEAIRDFGHQIGMIAPEIFSNYRLLTDKKLSLTRLRETNERGWPTLRQARTTMPLLKKMQMDDWCRLCGHLFDVYVAKYGRPDIIHAHATVYAGIAASRINRLHNVPYVITEHSSGFQRGLFRRFEILSAVDALNNSEQVVAVSTALKKSLVQLGIDHEPIVIPNVVMTDRFPLATPTEKPNDRFVFLAVAALDHNKGIDILLHAFRQSREDGSELAQLRVIGRGKERARLEALANELQIVGQVQFLGALDREKVAEEMRRAHCFVLPSRYETFGVVVIEALASGLPVVVTKCGGPEEVVTDEVAIVVEKENPTALARAMDDVREKRRFFEPERQRRFVEDRYSPSIVAAQYSQVYEEAIANN